jgi:hypothetical protein
VSASRAGTHECPYKTCERNVTSRYLACRAHWMKVPRHLREELYEAARIGSLEDYTAVRTEAIEAMNAR